MKRRLVPALQTAALLLAALFAILPLYWMAVTSFSRANAVLTWPPRLLPDLGGLTFDAYTAVLTGTSALRWLANSAGITVASIVVALAVSVPAGYALSRSRGTEVKLMGAVLLISKMLPATVLLTPLYVLARAAGLLDQPAAVVLGNLSFAVPLATWMMKEHFDKVPVDLEEAAWIDGCSRLRGLWSVILPQARPAMAAVTAYVGVVSWNDFIFARTLLTGGDSTTVTVGAAMMIGEYNIDWPRVMALALLATLPVLAMFALLHRQLMRGMSSGMH
ncbi:carbohydrate ABC transporter membrane protein 2 (CUT1 family) [Stella humosa]|uniref:Maltose/maltodextrin transport system permease protein MalG n=1 Tax=Stella humosa TaxID=94 RepID=A0A3N1MA57_9PROT|nr:carbohydrate ABC transporter permease [Stella humosa]ROP99586.1 carbohydrate ABC transporter membrane protein 2 (CUT1 family) [Stella humosa]BBK31189.1 ABC transporter permease [Stella humosa]